MFPNKYKKTLDKKLEIEKKYKEFTEGRKQFYENVIKLKEEVIELEKSKSARLEEDKRRWNELNDARPENIAEEEVKLQKIRQLYVNICYTHINKLLNTSVDIISLYNLKKTAVNEYFKSIDKYDEYTKMYTLDDAYICLAFFSNKISDENEFNTLVDKILDQDDRNATYQIFNSYYQKYKGQFVQNIENISAITLKHRINQIISKTILTFDLGDNSDNRITSLESAIQSLNCIEFCDKNFIKQKKIFLNLNQEFKENNSSYIEKEYKLIEAKKLDNSVKNVKEIRKIPDCEPYEIDINDVGDEVRLLSEFRESISNEDYTLNKTFEPFTGAAYSLNESIGIDLI